MVCVSVGTTCCLLPGLTMLFPMQQMETRIRMPATSACLGFRLEKVLIASINSRPKFFIMVFPIDF